MSINLASAWEVVSDTIGDQEAVINGELVRSWTELEDRAGRVAGGLRSAGVGHAQNVGLCLYNGNEYTEAQFAVMKERAFPFNVNYRYTAEELRDLLADADATAVFFSVELRDRFEDVHRELPAVKLFVQVGGDDDIADFAVGYEELVDGSAPASRLDRSPDDLWLLFTGGTTGRPKGVMWPHGTLLATMANAYRAIRVEPPDSLGDVPRSVLAVRENDRVTRLLAAAPLMHGTSGMNALSTFLQGGCVITLAGHSFDAEALWRCVQERAVTHMAIVGDAFARPMVDALDAAAERGESYDLSSLFLIMSSGVMWSAPVKNGLLAHHPGLRLFDSLGSSEGAGFAQKIDGRASSRQTASFVLGPDARVLTEDGRDVEPGSGERGRLALGGHLPLGYYNDPVKTAETFPVIDGTRYSIPGDWATVEADRSIVLLGRGSVCINTGGEKVYPEEVEEALKLVDGVVDANVVGVPDERWGQAITAVVELAAGADVLDGDFDSELRIHLAGYKVPKAYVRVPRLHRAPNGKSDYPWALATAKAALGIE